MPATTLPLPRTRADLPATMRAAIARHVIIPSVIPRGHTMHSRAAMRAAASGATRDDTAAAFCGLYVPGITKPA